uniref:MCM C-terminal AAA(+) ATPase domain-containing protein n=1 Tax=Magnetococcus massalia (strain MO-1) TaxID=451514 RepID=A0A1S7LJA4_MAGMO|nr:conserved protein of unknown function [Include Magnesium chelatase domain] [Candidatus Magnetococcus massalia]
MLARIFTIALEGVAARLVEVEVDLSNGLPALNMVGLPEATVRESKDRVRSALKNGGWMVPAKRVTINFAPADLPKSGSLYDLPVAVGLLTAMGVLEREASQNRLILGELALDGRIKPVPGCMPAAILAQKSDYDEIILPQENGQEASLVKGVRVIPVANLAELVGHLSGAFPIQAMVEAQASALQAQQSIKVDFAEIKGQEQAKRAMEVVAAGGHNLLMNGPPGSGKSMLASALPSILPPLSSQEMLEVSAVHSVAGHLSRENPYVAIRPYRSPHHNASAVALVVGGSTPRPGEVSLAHRGVLFLDELTEFPRQVLEALREPMESGDVTISRASQSAHFPARFQLIAACNPCPCGHLGDANNRCICTPVQIDRYQSRLSGPLLDRIDLHLEVPAVDLAALAKEGDAECSLDIRQRVVAARGRQQQRQGEGVLNSMLSGRELEQHASLADSSRQLLLQASKSLGFSARAFHRIQRVARTLADLDDHADIQTHHIAESIQYRTTLREKRASSVG